MIHAILSAFLYVFGSFFPVSSLLTMTTFFIPLCLLDTCKIKVRDSLMWGIIVFVAHWWWLLVLLHTKCISGWSYLLWTMLVIWCICLSSIWFYCLRYTRLWSTVVFFVVMSHYSMFLGGVIEGSPLFNPLVPLAYFPWTLHCLYWFSDIGMLVVLFAMQIALVDLWRYKTVQSACTLVGCMMIMACGYWTVSYQKEIQHTFVTVCPWWYGEGNPMFTGYRMSHDICTTMQKNKNASMIIMPESTFCGDVKEYKNFVPIWCDSAEDVPILFGAHLAESGFAHNAILLLHNNIFLFCYRKQHFMPLIERSIWIERFLGQSLMSSTLLYPPITQDQDLLKIDGIMFQIFICSEFFFEAKPVKGYPIMLLWNESWLQLDYAKQLAVFFINYFEKKYRVPILHMSTQGHSNI